MSEEFKEQEKSEELKKDSVQDSVLAAIEAGRVQMRPRWQFILKGALMAAGLVLAALALLFTGSFIIFILQQSGAWFAPAFGSPGVRELFTAMPLIFVAVALIFIVLLQLLVRRYSFSYHQPVLYSVVGIAAFVVLGSFLIAQTHFHEGLFKQARNQQLPIAGGFYREFAPSHTQRITPGIVLEVNDAGFNMQDPNQQIFTVLVNADTQMPDDQDFDVGDDVIVLGERIGNIITAQGVHKFEGREDMFEIHIKPDSGRQAPVQQMILQY